jgi:hypothetical protein
MPALLLCLAACKDDNPSIPDYAVPVSGQYDGYFEIYAKVGNAWEALPDASQANGFELERTSARVVSLLIDEVRFSDNTIDPAEEVIVSSIVISNVKVTKNGTKYNIAANNAAVTVVSHGVADYNNGVATLSGTIDPALEGLSSATIEMELRNTRNGDVLDSKSVKIIFETLLDQLPD